MCVLFCLACESCVITLLEDLSTMGSELRVIEFQMQSINTSAQLLGQMKYLEVRSKQLEVTPPGFPWVWVHFPDEYTSEICFRSSSVREMSY